MADRGTINYVSKVGSNVMESLQNNLVFEGKAFSSRNIVTVPASGAYDIVFDPTSFQGRFIVAFPPSLKSSAGPASAILYSGPTYSGGDDAIVFNRDFTKTTESQTSLKLGVTVTDPGEEIVKYLLGGASQGVFTSSGSSEENIPVRVNPNVPLLVRHVNDDTSDNDFEYNIIWYELK
jgi:hypothetical protein